MAADHGRAKLARDAWWNVVSLAVAGGLGILLNYLITLAYGASALGVFNQVFAVYLLVTQLAALGCHYSVLTHVATTRDRAERRAAAISGLVATSALGIGFSGLLWLLASPIGVMLKSSDVAQGLHWAAPGVLFYALSKVTLGCLNALRRMRWYAILFGGRFVVMVAAFAACAAFRVDQAALPGILTLSEAVVFTTSLGPMRSCLGKIPISVLRRWRVQFPAWHGVSAGTAGNQPDRDERRSGNT
jgi:O-antigen/teichoic acid export membrane protein